MSKKRGQFEELICRNRKVILHVCMLYSRNREVYYEDLIQEASIALWKEFKRFRWTRIRNEASEPAWVYRIACNAAAHYMSRHKLQEELMSDVGVWSGKWVEMPPIEEETLVENEHLLRLISQLGKDDREMVMLFLKGQKYSQIARQMGISETAVGTRMSRIYSKLREKNEEQAKNNIKK